MGLLQAGGGQREGAETRNQGIPGMLTKVPCGGHSELMQMDPHLESWKGVCTAVSKVVLGPYVALCHQEPRP